MQIPNGVCYDDDDDDDDDDDWMQMPVRDLINTSVGQAKSSD